MRTAVLPALALALAALPALAQAPPDVADILEEITSTESLQAAGKASQDVASAPADVTVLTARDLQALGYRTLRDALAGVQGFRANDDRAYQGLGMRGLYVLGDQNSRVLVLLDGHALNSPADVGASRLGEDFGLPLELVDHVEIIRGPASSLYGNNAFLALVNVVSQEAAGTGKGTLAAAVTAGSGGLGEAWAQARGTAGGFQASLTASGFRRSGTSILQPELQSGSVPAEADQEKAQSLNLGLRKGGFSLAGFLLDRTQSLALAPYLGRVGEAGNQYRNRRMGAEARFEAKQERAAWTFRLYGDRTEFRGDYLQDPARGGAGPAWDRDPDRSLGAEVQSRLFLADAFTLTLGTEWRNHRFEGISTSGGGVGTVGTRVAARIGNTYAEGEWRPAPAWTLVAGLQYATLTPTEVVNTVDAGASALPRDAVGRTTPRLAVIWKPGPRDTFKLLYGQGFRFPTFFERYYTDQESQAANPTLAPEVVTTVEGIWSRRWNARLRTQVSATRFAWDKLIYSGTVAGEGPMGGAVVYLNRGERIEGAAWEAEASLRLGSVELYGGLGAYRWTADGTSLGNVAERTAVLRGIHRSGSGSLALEGRYVGPRSLSGGASVPGNVQFRASYRLEWRRSWFQVTAEDLGDRPRRDLVGAEYAPVETTATDGRRLLATVGTRF